MHFVGMLAFSMPMAMEYNTFWTVMSMIIAIISSGFGLVLMSRQVLTLFSKVIGGVIMGLGIAAMHYTGMEAMKVSMNIHYLPTIFILSILIAIIASETAIWLNTKGLTFKHRLQFRVLSAIIMGIAIAGMHYTGMAAAIFTPSKKTMSGLYLYNPTTLSYSIAVVTFILMTIALCISFYKQAIQSMLEKKNEELETAKANLELLNTHLEHRVLERTEELEQSLSYIQATLDSTNDGILVVNLEKSWSVIIKSF